MIRSGCVSMKKKLNRRYKDVKNIMLPQKTVKTVQQTNYFTRFATWSTHEFPQNHSKFSRIDQFCNKKITDSPSSQQNWYVLRTCWTSYFDAKLVNQTKLRMVRWFQSNWSVLQQKNHWFTKFATKLICVANLLN